MKHALEIRAARAAGTMIRVGREHFESGTFDGYVLAIGPEFYLLETVNDDIDLGGYVCLRFRDSDPCRIPCPTQAFQEKVLALRGRTRPEPPEVDVSSLEALVQSAGALYPVITLHLDEAYPGTCYIGEFLEVKDGKVFLREISPDGEWIEEPDGFDLVDITRVDFGGRYEEALVLVANAGGPQSDEP